MLEKGAAAALIGFNELRVNSEYYLDEREMNLLGYDVLFNDYKPEAVEAFRLNVILFPGSFNVYDSKRKEVGSDPDVSKGHRPESEERRQHSSIETSGGRPLSNGKRFCPY
jgi:hypothetical protein